MVLKFSEPSRSRQRIFRCRLQCQIDMNLVFHISEDGSEINILFCGYRSTVQDYTKPIYSPACVQMPRLVSIN